MTDDKLAPLKGGGLSALRGPGGRLFLERDGDWRVEVAYAVSNPNFRRLTDIWRCILETRGRLLKKRGLHLYVLVCPDAHFIYRDELPKGLDLAAKSTGRLFAQMMTGIDNVTIIHPEAQLVGARGGLDPYMANDTHWSYYGAFIAYRALIEALPPGTPMQALRAAQINYLFAKHFGDLGAVVEPELVVAVPHPRIPGGSGRDVWKRADEYRNRWVRTASDRGRGKLLIAHDSAATLMHPFLRNTFAQVDWLGTSSRLFLEAIDGEKPDVVVWEVGERRLHLPELDQHTTTAYETYAWDAAQPTGRLALEACDLRDAGQLPGAIALVAEALKLSPTDANLHYLNASLHLRHGEAIAAEQAARAAIALRDDRPAYWQLLATALRPQSRWPDALAASRRAAQLSPDNALYVAEFGHDLLALGKVDRAVEVMSRCRKNVSTSNMLCYWLAHAYLRAGDPVSALAEARQALMLNPEHPPFQELASRLWAESKAHDLGDCKDGGVLIAGHSHTVCLGLGKNEAGPAEIVKLRSGPPAILGIRHTLPAAPEFLQMVVDIGQGHDLALLWHGNSHNSKYLLSPGKPFDFVLSSECDLPLNADAELVPESLLIQGLAWEMDLISTAVSRLMAASPSRRLTLVSPPPPKGDDDHIRMHLATEFKPHLEFMGYSPSDVPLTAAAVRLKIWKLFVRLHAELATRLNVNFLSVPPGCFDASGFLLKDYWHHDVTHANQLYGELLLEHIAKHFAVE